MKPFDPDPASYPTWLKVSIIEGAIQKMEAPRQVYLSTKASLKLMNPQHRSYLDEAFRLAYRIFYFESNAEYEEYKKLVNTLVRMMRKESESWMYNSPPCC